MSNAEDIAEFMTAVTEKKETPVVTEANKISNEMAEAEAMGINLFVAVMLASPPMVSDPMVFMSSDGELLLNEIPEDITESLESGESYALLENGVSEWGLEDEQLMVVYDVGKEFYGGAVPIYSLGFKPMHDEIARIDDFYNKQKKQVNTVVSIVIACALAILTLLTFFWLRYLIRSKITKPIEELEDAAEKVMEGDLDVVVPVREGEEFTNLKKAFNGMLSSIRDVINKATGD